MNEVQLSNNLTTIETEIKSYQNLAGQSIFEIGRRLKHVKENNLAHGEFGKWLESINMNNQQAHRFMKVSEEYEQSNLTTSLNLGLNVLYEIATLPEPERNKEHVTTKGETKTPDEMTVKELRELKKQLKQRDEEKKQLENQLKNSTRSEEILQDKLEQLENKPPKVIERFLEPEDYQQIKTSLEQKESYINELQTEVANMRNERNEMDKKSREYDRLNEAINEMNGRLNEGQMRIKNQKAVYDLIRKSEELVKEVAPLVYALDHLDVEDNEYAKKPIIQLIKNIDDISQKLKKQLSERQIIEVN
ncbi:MAG TPA: DUF3102 domain-containing protein [Candidatus Nosocomiicoccus stercorigallinarum]|nr:DUF3102 domain-containing protein [Candidatus Nosocomiicoccus stercorigallinarum]